MRCDVGRLVGRAHGGTLFLDRDGVINRKIDGDYVRSWSDFEFLPGALDGLARLATVFSTIVVVTNQRGVGRGLMTEGDLSAIHRRMLEGVTAAGGRIDGVYHCPHDLPAGCQCRKPRLGLVRQAIREHPGIDLLRAVLVGDSDSDMVLARRLGVPGVLVGASGPQQSSRVAATVGSLLELGAALQGALRVAALAGEGVRP